MNTDQKTQETFDTIKNNHLKHIRADLKHGLQTAEKIIDILEKMKEKKNGKISN